MELKKIKLFPEIKKIDRIVHLADIHIRNLKRHKEYRETFKKVYSLIKKCSNKNTIIYIGGDLTHSKTEMSPELINMMGEFLVKISSINPVILIAGNHDTNLQNPHRLDTLSPVINLLKNKNIHYLKDSGIYSIGNVDFVVMSVFDEPENFIKASSFNANTKIALYHGAIAKSKTDFGFELPSDVDTSIFRGYDLALLGDIHKRQFLNKKETIAYPGSLLQQNHGELLEHGFLCWDVPMRKSKFIRVENDYGYYTLDIINSQIPDVNDIPKHPRLRLRFKDTPASDINSILAVVRKKYTPHEITQTRLGSGSDAFRLDTGKNGNIDIRDIDVQNKLISEYLLNQGDFVIDESMLKRIRNINKELNSQIVESELLRNIRWKIKRFEFSNMFSYGEDNRIDFTDMNGVYGLFGMNSGGKSSAFSAIQFCLFDKCDRAFRGIDVMNSRKTTFHCKLNFEINGVDYFIEKKAKKRFNKQQNKETVKVDIDFWNIDSLGNKHSLKGEQRDDTNANIRSYVGTYDDFILTAISLQNNFANFISMKQSERKDLLVQFLDLKIFDILYDLASMNSKEILTILKDLKKHDYAKMLVDVEELVQKFKKEYDTYKKQKGVAEDNMKILQNDILEHTKKLIPINNSIRDIKILNELKEETENSINSISNNISILEKKIDDCKKRFIVCYNELQQYDIDSIFEKYDILNELETKHSQLEIKKDKFKIEILNKLEKLRHLEEHEYDPECEYCIKNVFVVDALKTKEELEHDKITAQEILSDLDDLEVEIKNYSDIKKLYDVIVKLQNEINSIKNETISIKSKILALKNNLIHKETELDILKNEILEYEKNKDNIKHNKVINSEISDLESELQEIEMVFKQINNKMISAHSNIKINETEKNKIIENIDRIHDLEEEYDAFKFYIEAICKDGVPYDLISKSIPAIEQEINNILAQVVDFSILLELDGKNINIILVHSEEERWLLELGGGMEKFISSTAIRAALINFSNLPRPNFLAIDEGFSNADYENINQLPSLFDYLRTQFDFIICITHSMIVKDMMDNIINVNKINTYSKVNY